MKCGDPQPSLEGRHVRVGVFLCLCECECGSGSVCECGRVCFCVCAYLCACLRDRGMNALLLYICKNAS